MHPVRRAKQAYRRDGTECDGGDLPPAEGRKPIAPAMNIYAHAEARSQKDDGPDPQDGPKDTVLRDRKRRAECHPQDAHVVANNTHCAPRASGELSNSPLLPVSSSA